MSTQLSRLEFRETTSLGPLLTVFTLTLRQFLRGRRALVLLVLALLPAGLALLVRSIDADGHHHGPPKLEIEFVFLFMLIPHALLPLTALLYGSGLILDEQEDQTLTYLLIRPVPKWGLYLAKFLAGVCITSLLTVVFVLITFLAIYVGSPEWWDVFPKRMLATLGVMILSATAYVAVFGALSLLVNRSLIVGFVYIGIVEVLLANIPFAIRQLSVMFYLRVPGAELAGSRYAHEARMAHCAGGSSQAVRMRADSGTDRRSGHGGGDSGLHPPRILRENSRDKLMLDLSLLGNF